jgi:hypothetical protein
MISQFRTWPHPSGSGPPVAAHRPWQHTARGSTSPAAGEAGRAPQGHDDAMRNESMTTRARGSGVRWTIAALLCAGTMMIGASGSSGSPTASAVSAGTGSPAGQAHVNCATVDSLRGSLQSLQHTSVSPSAASTLTKDLTNVQKQLAALKTQDGGRFSGLSGDLSASVNQITKAAGELTTNPAAAVKDLTAALTGLKGKIPPAIAELDKACPKPGT